jgi:molybdopterin-containing oxidoreductase family membrane subunit
MPARTLVKPETVLADPHPVPLLLRPLFVTGSTYKLVASILAALVAWAGFCFIYQAHNGLGIAGIRRPVFWAFYITDFVFWIGISHAGTLISAILRLSHATWRRPITRCAEAITVFALMIGGMFPIIHLGRPWLFYWLIPYPTERLIWPNFRSPLVWDLFAIMTYLTGSLLYLYLPLIPDLGLARDRTQRGWRHRLYRALALNWRGTQRQWQRLELAIALMAAVIIAVAVSVHTVVSWDFAMAIVPTWHSTIFGPYFVTGAIFSGIAALIIAMYFLRRLLHLEDLLKPIHFDNLGKLLLTMSLLWAYFIAAEMLTIWYGNDPSEMAVFWGKVSREYAPLFWTMVVCNFIIPFPVLAVKKLRTIRGTLVASCTVVIGMWLERFLIVVPGGGYRRMAFNIWTAYRPRWPEISITVGTFAAMALLYMIFVKLFPIISIWELGEVPVHVIERAPQTSPAIVPAPETAHD